MNVLDKVCEWAFKSKVQEKYSKISLNRATPCWVKKTSLRFPITLDVYDLQRILHWLFNYNIVQLGTKCFSQMKEYQWDFLAPLLCATSILHTLNINSMLITLMHGIKIC